MKTTLQVGLLLAVLAGSLGWVSTTRAASPELSSDLQKAVKKIEATIEPSTAARGTTVIWRLTLDLADGWHTYPTSQPDSEAKGIVTKFQFPSSPDVVFVGKLTEPGVKSLFEAGMQLNILEGKVVWERPVVVSPSATPGEKSIKVKVTSQVCTSKCLPLRVEVEAPLTITTVDPVPVDPRYQKEMTSVGTAAQPSIVPPAGNSTQGGTQPTLAGSAASPPVVKGEAEETAPAANQKTRLNSVLSQLQVQKTAETGLGAFMLAGVFWGAISLVTPCVFPMIPITVSFFLKQSEKEHHRPVAMALVYCSTIVVVLTLAAVTLLSFFRWLSINPVMNIGMGILFVLFALSLFGMYDLELPGGLARFTSSREGRGGFVGTMFMALTFTILSFACVAPFLGGFGGTAATSNLSWVDRILGGLAFSATFAAPFFILALFPSLLKKMPKSGSWLNSVKVVMGFLELAAALKFFRAGELVLMPRPTLFTYDFVLGIWVALSLLCGLYLLNLYRLPHDTPSEHLSVPQLLASLLFLGLAFYLMPALFKVNDEGEKQRPNGVIYAWVDSFLLPEAREGKGSLTWTGDLKQAIDEARADRQRTGQRKLVFVDFNGKTCTNCKYNEQNFFSRPDIKTLFQPYERVQLYTDEVPDELYPPEVRNQFGGKTDHQEADAAANLWFQDKAFGTTQLPLYVILEPLPNGTIAVVGKYSEGKINDEGAFARFLKDPLQGNAADERAMVSGKE